MRAAESATPGAFCWLDLAASDADVAMAFYSQVFGWRFEAQRANGGRFTRCRVGECDVGSLYSLKRAQLERGVPSHWTPYVRVEDIDALVPRIAPLGGRVLVAPFDVEHTARIALVEDAVGAVLGLWESPAANRLGKMNP